MRELPKIFDILTTSLIGKPFESKDKKAIAEVLNTVFKIRDLLMDIDAEKSKKKRSKKIARAAHLIVDVTFRIVSELPTNENPYFGDLPHDIKEDLVFVIMPFKDERLNIIYEETIKPIIKSFGLNCHRADTYPGCMQGAKYIIQGLASAIAESLFTIADLTYFMPNVLYELGIAHTRGTETILIFQEGRGDFPTLLAGRNRIRYDDSNQGIVRLEKELKHGINSILGRTSS